MFDSDAVIDFHHEVAHGTRLMALVAPDMARSAAPGQFVMARPRQGPDPLLRRPFSICGLSDRGRILILYKVVGRGTRILSGLQPGDSVRVMGPLGRGFDVAPGAGPAVLVAGGMGIAPLLFLARVLAETGERFRFLAGFRGRSDLVPPDRLPETGAPMELATDDGSAGHHGPVTDLLRPLLEESPGVRVFACGPGPMLKRVAELSAAAGAPCRVSLESAMACGLGACLGCAVPMKPGSHGGGFLYTCKDGPVFEAGDLDWERL